VLERHREPVAVLMQALLDAVAAFAGGAPQEDDMTLVLVKREPGAGAQRSFARTIDALPAIVAFTEEVFAERGLDPRLRPNVDFALEELFTNMVKYSPMGVADVRIDVAAIEGVIEVTMTDYGVAPFDVTRAPDADIATPVERREPGGLGLHLTRRLVDSLRYDYDEQCRESRTTFRVTTAGLSRSADAG